MVGEVAESNANLRRHYWHTELQRAILAYLDDGRETLWNLSAITGKSREKVAWALGHLITKGYVVAVREDGSLKFEKVPGSLFNFILEHEV